MSADSANIKKTLRAEALARRDGLDPRGCKHVRALAATGLLPDAPASSLN